MESREFVIRANEEGVRCGVITIGERVEFVYHRSHNDWVEHIHAYASKVKELPVFIHGLWGDRTKVYNKMVNKVSQDILPDYPLVLHIVWEGKSTYNSNHDLIDDNFVPKITKLMIMVDKLLNRPDMKILAHSMGCRLATQLFKNVIKGRGETQKYTFIFAAADLPIDMFDKFVSESLEKKDTVHVLYSPNDITLKLANFRKKYERLGLIGSKSQTANVHNHLIAKQKDEEIFLSAIFGHRYFYSSKTIRKMIKNLISESGQSSL
jgi:hypothetical protein